MKKSTPPTVKHLNCECKIVDVDSGPHKRKIVCIEHNAFVQWVPKDYEFTELDQFILERCKQQTESNLFKNGNLFDKMKFSYTQPNAHTQSIIDKLKGVN